MYTAIHLSPMIPSYDLKETISFFESLLDFTIKMHETGYAILEKDDLLIHILRAGPDIGEMEFYLEVDDVEKIWKKIEPRAKEFSIKEPFDREYGMREIHIIIPQTRTLLFIGQPIDHAAEK